MIAGFCNAPRFLAVTALLVVSASESMAQSQRSPPANMFLAIAKLENKSRVVNGETYQLLIFRVSSGFFNVTDTRATVGLIAGLALDRDFPSASGDEMPPGKLPADIVAYWVRLPKSGEFEVICGSLTFDRDFDNAESDQRLKASGIKPIVIKESDIPVIKADSAEKLAEAMAKLSLSPATTVATSKPSTNPSTVTQPK